MFACARPCGSLRLHPESRWLGNSLRSNSPRRRGRFGTEAPPRPTQETKGRLDGSNEGEGWIGHCPSNPCLSSPTSFIGDPDFLFVISTLGRNPCHEQSKRSPPVKISCEVPEELHEYNKRVRTVSSLTSWSMRSSNTGLN